MICAGQQPFPPAQVWPAIQPVDSCQGDSGGEAKKECHLSQPAGLQHVDAEHGERPSTHSHPLTSSPPLSKPPPQFHPNHPGPLLALGGSEAEDLQHGIISFGIGCAQPGVPGARAAGGGRSNMHVCL